MGEAAAWFLQRGYVAAVPLTVAQYDLITDSDQGFKRVQVKTTTVKDRSGRWRVSINRVVYEPGLEGATQNGARARRAYRPDEVDLFFIVTGSGEQYLIPLEATGGAAALTLDEKYAAYRVSPGGFA